MTTTFDLTDELLTNYLEANPTGGAARQDALHPDLPKLLLALAGSSVNNDLAEYLKEFVPDEGTLKTSAKKAIDPDEPMSAPPAESQYTRPNGEVYYARDWGDDQDVLQLRKARAAGLNPLFFGPPGTGKTALCEAAFGEDLLTVVMSGDTEVRDLVGDYSPNPDYGSVPSAPEYVWNDGPLIRAMEGGLPLLLDEVGLMDPKVGSITYGAMDGRNELVVSMNQNRGIVKAKPGFFIIGATNPNAPGVQLSEALLSRFALHVEVTTDWELAVRLGVPNRLVQVAQALEGMRLTRDINWSPQFRELLAFVRVKDAYNESFAMSNLAAQCPEEDRQLVLETINRTYGKPVKTAYI